MNNKPYIVSADIKLLVGKWVEQNTFSTPSDEFFAKLRAEFSSYLLSIFPEFELVLEEKLVLGIQHLVDRLGLPTVSMDPVYFKGNFSLEMTRVVTPTGEDAGIMSRMNTPTLTQQIRMLPKNEIVLVDDVIFSGGMLERVVKMLSQSGIKVSSVIAGIGITEGIERLNRLGLSVYSVAKYDDVIDEVCERDFYPGVPFCGRQIDCLNASLPYLLPWGNPGKWATIPPNREEEFSHFCIGQSIRLFTEIGKISSKDVLCQDVQRKIFGSPTEGKFVDYLAALRE